MLRFLAVVAFVALASAATLDQCKDNYAISVTNAVTNDDRCRAILALSTCLNQNAMNMTHSERISGQGFYDAARLGVPCGSVPIPDVNVALVNEENFAHIEVSRENDVKLFRERAPEAVSIWDLNTKFNALASTVADKMEFEAVQKSVSAMQLDTSIAMADLKNKVLDVVESRLEALTVQIQTSMEATLASLKSVTMSMNSITMSRIGKIEKDIRTLSNGAIITSKTVAELAAENEQNNVVGRLSILETSTDAKINSALGDTKGKVDKLMTAIGQTSLVNTQLPSFRVAIWSTYSEWSGNWYAGNNAIMFGGVAPQVWTDNNGVASAMSSDKNVLRTLYTRRVSGGWNSVANSQEWYSYSSTNSVMSSALFRIRSTASSPVVWRVNFYYTSYTGWSETASAALNGASLWVSNNNCGAQCTQSLDLTIPPGRVSTAIFVSASSPQSGTRANYLAFHGDCLKLPSGLEYLDDLDYATGGWDQ